MSINPTGIAKSKFGSHDKAIADHILMHHVASPDPTRRPWYTALLHNLRVWRERRVYRPSKTPFEAAWECVQQTGGMYCEGLVMLPQYERPQPAIWCSTPIAVVCFTHDLTAGPHGIQGIPFADSAVQHLYFANGIRGPYLFHPNPQVFQVGVPSMIHRRIRGDDILH